MSKILFHHHKSHTHIHTHTHITQQETRYHERERAEKIQNEIRGLTTTIKAVIETKQILLGMEES